MLSRPASAPSLGIVGTGGGGGGGTTPQLLLLADARKWSKKGGAVPFKGRPSLGPLSPSAASSPGGTGVGEAGGGVGSPAKPKSVRELPYVTYVERAAAKARAAQGPRAFHIPGGEMIDLSGNTRQLGQRAGHLGFKQHPQSITY